MISGTLLPPPPPLVSTAVSFRPEELTRGLLSTGLEVVRRLPDVVFAGKVEARLSKNIGAQYCLKQTMVEVRERD